MLVLLLRMELPWVVQRWLHGMSGFIMPRLEGPGSGQHRYYHSLRYKPASKKQFLSFYTLLKEISARKSLALSH